LQLPDGALHSELKPKGIHVCGIYPSVIKRFDGASNLQRMTRTPARRDQLNQVPKYPVVEKPEDVAQAIWDAVKNQRSEVLVGSANLSKQLIDCFLA